MALILAVDPGGSQAQAIERLARELGEHELVLAASCAEAIATVERRAPDLVLLPALLPEGEEAELRSRLDEASGRVFTLTLPLLASNDALPPGRRSRWLGRLGARAGRSSTEACHPSVFAAQVREYLVAAPGAPHCQLPPEPRILPSAMPVERRAQLRAAAMSAAAWGRARRATWGGVTAARDREVMPAPLRAVPRPGPTDEPPRLEPPPTPRAPEIAWPPRAAAERPLQVPVRDRADAFPDGDTEVVPVAAVLDGVSVPALDGETMVAAQPIGVEAPARDSRGARVVITLRSLSGWFSHWLPRVAALAVLVALAAAGRAYWPALRGALTNGTAVLESVPAGSQLLIDGRAVGTTPLMIELPAGWHKVEFRDGRLSRTVEVVVVARGRVVERVDWTAKPTGSLQVDSDPGAARVLVDGEFRGTTPLKLDGLGAGTHAVTLESAAGTVRRTVTIAAGETAQMTELIFSGWLAVFSPFEVEVSEGSRSIPLDDRGRVMLPPGSHEFRFQNRVLGYDEVRRVEITPSATAALTLAPPPTTISIMATEPAEVWVDGTRIGDTPITDSSVGLGTREIIVRTGAGLERRFVVTATSKPVQLDVDFSKPQP